LTLVRTGKDGIGRIGADVAHPHPPTRFYELTGAMANEPRRAPLATQQKGDPVDSNQMLIVENIDLVCGRAACSCTGRPSDWSSGPELAPIWLCFVFGATASAGDSILRWRRCVTGCSPGTDGGCDLEHTSTPSAFYKSAIRWNGHGWDLTLKDGTVYVFGENAPLQAIRDRYGNTITVTHASGQTGNITRVTSPNGRWIDFSYDEKNRIVQALDNGHRSVRYTYDASGRLWRVLDPNGGLTYPTRRIKW
jgi:YD repeat-containing protein